MDATNPTIEDRGDRDQETELAQEAQLTEVDDLQIARSDAAGDPSWSPSNDPSAAFEMLALQRATERMLHCRRTHGAAGARGVEQAPNRDRDKLAPVHAGALRSDSLARSAFSPPSSSGQPPAVTAVPRHTHPDPSWLGESAWADSHGDRSGRASQALVRVPTLVGGDVDRLDRAGFAILEGGLFVTLMSLLAVIHPQGASLVWAALGLSVAVVAIEAWRCPPVQRMQQTITLLSVGLAVILAHQSLVMALPPNILLGPIGMIAACAMVAAGLLRSSQQGAAWSFAGVTLLVSGPLLPSQGILW